MAAGDETVITLTDARKHVGSADTVWTACNDGAGECRLTITNSATPPPASDPRIGRPFRADALLQGGGGGSDVHYHVRGSGQVIVHEGA